MCFWLILLVAGDNAQLQSLVGVVMEVRDDLVTQKFFSERMGGAFWILQIRNYMKRDS